MEQFNQTVEINVDVDVEDLENLAAAAATVEGLDGALEEIDTSGLDNAANSIKNFADETELADSKWNEFSSDNDLDSGDPLSNFRGSIRKTANEVDTLNDALDEEVTVNAEVDSEKFISDVKNNLETKLKEEEIDVTPNIAGELDYKSRSTLISDAKAKIEAIEETLASTDKGRITLKIDEKVDLKSGYYIEKIAEELQLTPDYDPDVIDNMTNQLTELGEVMEDTTDKKDELTNTQGLLEGQTDDTSDSTKDEAKSFKSLTSAGDKLSDVKRNVAESNKLLNKRNKESTISTINETKAQKQLAARGIKTEEFVNRLANTYPELIDEVDDASRSFGRVTDKVGDTRNEMRAANKIGDVFEDGLGSLSLNLGAFTVALRNFLTQVPLFLSGLGAMGSAAVGVAGSFLTAAAALGSVLGAGALSQAQSIKSEFESIEDLGKALQVMLQGVKDAFIQAFEPLTSIEETEEMFSQLVEGAAETASLFASTFAKMMPQIRSFFNTLGRDLRKPMEDLVSSLSFMFLNLQDEIEEITVGVVNALTRLIRFTTKFTDNINESTDALDEFINSLAEMSNIGKTALGGLSPIIEAFAVVMHSAANAINSLNSEFVANAITAAALVLAFNRLSGVIGGIITLVPNLITAILSSRGSVAALTKSFGGFLRQHPSLFAGFTTLAESVENLSGEMMILSGRNRITDETFDSLDRGLAATIKNIILTSNSTKQLNDRLINTAIEADITEDEIEELNKDLYQLGISSQIAAGRLDEINKLDTNLPLGVREDVAMLDEVDDSVKQSGESLSLFAKQKNKVSGSFGKLTGKVKKFGSVLVPTTGKLGGLSKSLGKLKGARVIGPIIGAVSGAMGSLSGAALSVVTALTFLIPAIAALLAVGGLAVGVIANFDEISSSLAATGKALGNVLKDLGSFLLNKFIKTWNALVPLVDALKLAFQPVIDLLSGAEDEGSGLSKVLDSLVAGVEFVIDIIIESIRWFSGIILIIGYFVGKLLSLITIIGGSLVRAFELGLKSMENFGDGTGAISKVIKFIQKLVQTVINLPEISQEAFRKMTEIIEESINAQIDIVNEYVKRLNEVFGTEFGTIATVDITRDGAEGLKTTRAEFAQESEGFISGLLGSRDPTINYEENNEQNLRQTINADPEDKATLGRVVKDAMNEANSFERRLQGGQ